MERPWPLCNVRTLAICQLGLPTEWPGTTFPPYPKHLYSNIVQIWSVTNSYAYMLWSIKEIKEGESITMRYRQDLTYFVDKCACASCQPDNPPVVPISILLLITIVLWSPMSPRKICKPFLGSSMGMITYVRLPYGLFLNTLFISKVIVCIYLAVYPVLPQVSLRCRHPTHIYCCWLAGFPNEVLVSGINLDHMYLIR
jgi:hypothetical protein